ncbi:MAG: isopentenyl phosphate kinase, partial [Haloarculaceae archaeon]
RPLSLAHRDTGLHVPTGSIDTMLAEGFVPLLHGDCVAHEGNGATILSGDDIVVALAESLSADRVGLCSTVPGVLDGDGEVVARIESFEDVAENIETSEQTDVTGGMAGKIRTLLDLPMSAQIFGLDDLPAFLAGETPGTTVIG